MAAHTSIYRKFPRHFWVMLAGHLLASLGVTLVWPFLLIFVSERLSLPMASVTSLMTINSLAGLISSIVVGSLLDRYGRKWIMVVGYLATSLVYLGYIGADRYWQFALLMFASGMFGPLQRVSASAMIADMFDAEDRRQAFALFRTAGNIGFGSGPILGGLLLAVSYKFGMLAAFGSLVTFALITIFFIPETLPLVARAKVDTVLDSLRGYADALKDKVFVGMISAYTFQEICARLIWVILAVYAKTNFAIPEARYGIIPTTNALMVVFLQVFVTQLTRKHPESRVMTIGSVFYPIAMLLVAFSNGFWGFWLAMVTMSIGELITAPTATVFVANIAPPEKRGRYLSLFSLTWYVALAIGPLGAGILTDNFGMRAPWFGGAVVGLLGVTLFWLLDRSMRRLTPSNPAGTTGLHLVPTAQNIPAGPSNPDPE